MFCENCGSEVADGSTFCQNCGSEIRSSGKASNEAVNVKNEKNMITALIFLLFCPDLE